MTSEIEVKDQNSWAELWKPPKQIANKQTQMKDKKTIKKIKKQLNEL